MNLDHLNSQHQSLSPEERLEAIYSHYSPEALLVTSSFGATSVILLHMISKVQPSQPIHFIDTGYHFDETLGYKEMLKEWLNIEIIDVRTADYLHDFTDKYFTYHHNQDLCCYINKVEPVNLVKEAYPIWVSGVLRFQNANRAKMQVFQQSRDVIKFHPILDMTEEEVALYLKLHDLPVHPLVDKGYDSIGCSHCTVKGSGRTGRWMNSSKTECGLHT